MQTLASHQSPLDFLSSREGIPLKAFMLLPIFQRRGRLLRSPKVSPRPVSSAFPTSPVRRTAFVRLFGSVILHTFTHTPDIGHQLANLARPTPASSAITCRPSYVDNPARRPLAPYTSQNAIIRLEGTTPTSSGVFDSTPSTGPMAINITAFEECPGVVVLHTKFDCVFPPLFRSDARNHKMWQPLHQGPPPTTLVWWQRDPPVYWCAILLQLQGRHRRERRGFYNVGRM